MFRNISKLLVSGLASQNEDPNYSSSVFMVLALAKELQKLNHTEEDAFK